MGTQLPQTKRVQPPTQFSAHVYCGQTAGWMKMPLGTEVDIVLDGDPAPPPLLHSVHPSPQPKRQIDRFSRFAQLTAERPYTLQWAPFLEKLPQPMGIWPLHLTHDSLGPSEPSTQTASRSVQPFFAELTSVTDRPTDRPRYSACSNKPHVGCYAA